MTGGQKPKSLVETQVTQLTLLLNQPAMRTPPDLTSDVAASSR